MHSEQNNLNFTLSGLFCLGAEFQKLCQEQLQESTTGESCVPQQTLLTPRHISHRAWTKSWFCKKNTPALHHFFLLPVTKVRRVQKRHKCRWWTSQACQPDHIPYWSHKRRRREISLPVSMSSIEPNPLEVACKEDVGKGRQKILWEGNL